MTSTSIFGHDINISALCVVVEIFKVKCVDISRWIALVFFVEILKLVLNFMVETLDDAIWS